MQPGYLGERSLGYVQLTSLAAATGLTVPAGTSLILIQAQTQAVRWRDDGVDPTATVGQPLAVGVEMRYTAADSSRLKFIEQAASAALNVTFYGVA